MKETLIRKEIGANEKRRNGKPRVYTRNNTPPKKKPRKRKRKTTLVTPV
jgi:hypothetical protein